MDFNFSKGDAFERITHYPQIEIKEMARVLASLDPNIRSDQIPPEKSAIVNEYNTYLVRVNRMIYNLLSSNGKNKELNLIYPKEVATNSPIEANILFSSCFILIEKDLTPKPIQDRCLSALPIVFKKYGEAVLNYCGGEQAIDIAKNSIKGKRGEHKKQEENASLYKIIGILSSHIAKERAKSGSSKWIKNSGLPSIDPIYQLIQNYARDNQITPKGIGKSTCYEKIKLAILSLNDD
ncbi:MULTISPECIES: hypothetical protein [Hafnia]|jgi:hypothetical protein|uniref:hypothetical protein n=1 Tax=Hafnia TaxID=568 RepID=UPI00057F6AA0|nr:MULTISPECIES: hypothetical protein [Hafnia]KAA0261773.1 hypothetical protein ERL64_13930 [Hafnia alvei]KHS50054.1 hypothetical protein RN38_03575 [Hafnia paralvei]TBL55343.1 hypothetical protein EYZ00_04785 [Hafnia paralvei]